MAKQSIKHRIKNYFTKKKWYSISSDFLFVVLIILLIIPSTRIVVTSFFIRVTSLPPSTLNIENRYQISEDAAKWTIRTLDGKQVEFCNINEKPVFLNIWATWCPPCIAELPGIIELYEKYKNDINFVLVTNENAQQVKNFIRNKQYPAEIFFLNNTLPGDFYSKSIPISFIVDKNGHVIVNEKGAARWNSEKVKKILNELTNNK